MGPEVFISMSEYPPCNTYTNERRSIDQISKQYVISTITTRSARSDNTCEGGVEPTENIYKICERAVARHLFSFPNSQNVVLSVLSVATLRVASTFFLKTTTTCVSYISSSSPTTRSQSQATSVRCRGTPWTPRRLSFADIADLSLNRSLYRS